jgi:hypothetical protein
MLDPLDVGRPVDVGGILRPGDDEAAIRQRARGGSISSRSSVGCRSGL